MGGLSFLAPLALLGLLTLPLIWWILRVAPPAPKVQSFPPLQLFADMDTDEETPAKTPLWLLLFRMLMVALIAVSLAGPILKRAAIDTQKPLLLIIENSWLAAPFWSDIMAEAEAQIKKARRENVDVALAFTNDQDESVTFGPAQSALNSVKTLAPEAWLKNELTLNFANKVLNLIDKDVVYLSSGLSSKLRNDSVLETIGDFSVYVPTDSANVILPQSTQEVADGFESQWHRPISGPLITDLTIQAFSPKNVVLARSELNFGPGAKTAMARFEVPAQIRNRVSHLKLEGANSAGSVFLLDDSWGRPLIGLLSGTGDTTSPLLSEPFYARTALQPYADIFDGDLETLLSLNPSLIIMPDSQRTEDERLVEFVETGGVLIRFAGEKLAKRSDLLLPVELRGGGRAIGGALSWETPQKLAAFETNSPFFGLDISDEITVSRQVMAEPGIETDTKSWARLEDGSPVVTASIKGDGLLVLFHVTAGPEWSNLALSGLYVDMLRRVLPLAKNRNTLSTEDNQSGEWVAKRVLNGFGQFEAPSPQNRTIPSKGFETTQAGAFTLPGLYKRGTQQRALQTVKDVTNIIPLEIPSNAIKKQYAGTKLQNLAGIGLAIGLIGLALDALFALYMAGRLSRLLNQSSKGLAMAVMAFFVLATTDSAFAQIGSEQTSLSKEIQAATGLHLAYIKTDNGRVDRLTENGLESLGKQLAVRTTIDVEGVHGVDPASDTLAFYPFLYWVVSRDTEALSDEAVIALNGYMEAGGTILFDTRDATDQSITGNTPHPGLERLTAALDIPRLVTVPSDHVLTRSFYLLQSFPGRWANGQVWVDARSNAAGRDGVSPVIIGANDWAAAWALDETNRPIIETDESLPRQREFAARFGVNLVMYALAGNYKADQVHTAELIKRLGDQAKEAGFDVPITDDDIDSDGAGNE